MISVLPVDPSKHYTGPPLRSTRSEPNPDLAFHEGAALQATTLDSSKHYTGPPLRSTRNEPNPDLAFHEGAALKSGGGKKKQKDPIYRGAIKKISPKNNEFAKIQKKLKQYHGMFYGTGLNPWD